MGGHGCGARRGDRRGRVLASGACLQRRAHPSTSPSPEPPARSATRCCSASPPGQLLGPDTPVRLRLLEIPQAVQGRRGHRDGARRLRVPAARRDRHHRRRRRRRSTASTSRCWSAPARGPRAWSAATCSRPTAASSPRRAGRSTPAPPTTSACWSSATRPTPTRSSPRPPRPDVPADRFTAMTRLDHNRARRPARRRSSACRSPRSAR